MTIHADAAAYIKDMPIFEHWPEMLRLYNQVAALEHGHYQFKLYFDDSNKSGIYSEIFFNANLPEGIVEFPDIDPIHFDGFLKAMIR